MNLYSLVLIGCFLIIPLALLYRILNPLPPKEKPPERRKIGAIHHCSIQHMQEAWAGRPVSEMTAHYDREAALDAMQIAEDARQKAVQKAEKPAQRAELPMGVKKALCLLLAAPLILLLRRLCSNADKTRREHLTGYCRRTP